MGRCLQESTMPLPMVHLAVAVRICGLEGVALSPDFLLGSIAPDAIHMRTGSSPHDKQATHFAEIPDPQHERLRELFTSSRSQTGSTRDFSMGYVTHILTDQLWGNTIVVSFGKSIPSELSDQECGKLYYQETDQIDIDLYRQAPWRAEVWKKLTSAQPNDFTLLLTADEITRWRDRTQVWYVDPAHDPKITPVHITRQEVDAFIGQAAEEIVATFRSWRA